MSDIARGGDHGAPTLLLCDCAGTMRPDPEAITRGTGLSCTPCGSALCTSGIGALAEALAAGTAVMVGCAQEADRFGDLAAEIGGENWADTGADTGARPRLITVDLRDRAGWTESGADPGPKMAALVADARLEAPPVPLLDVKSGGLCLVYGAAEVALPAAERLSIALGVTVMLTGAEPVAAAPAGLDIVTGRVRRLTGALGRFELEADGFAPLSPAGRGPRSFGPGTDGAVSACDIVLDLSGAAPLVPAHEKRDGYLRADPRDPIAVERALFDAAQLVGDFEKPLHIRLTDALCAHSRAGQTGCTRCLDVCPTGAIAAAGDHVAIDAQICAGCGACSAVCPSGAAATEEPPVAHLFARMRAMAAAFRAAGGAAPRLLVHEAEGAEAISLGARHGRGLPADLVPLEIPALASFGHAEMLAALGLGFSAVDLLAARRSDREVIAAQIALAVAVLSGTGAGGPRLRLVDEADPDAMLERLHGAAPGEHNAEPILALGGRRETVRLAARALAGDAARTIPLPQGAPYGAVVVDPDACTLCMACAGLCPTGALGDNPERPELSFREEACIQCGLCAGLCPERAITLVPQLDLSDAALTPRVLHEEEPFACISCGKLFGVKSTIERITAKLSAHAMFQNSDNARLIQMCDDCRVRAQYHGDSAPFRMGERPAVRTTADYLQGDGED